MTPDDRKYTESHEWIKEEEDIALVGITDHAQDALGDITYVELPDKGESVDQGNECGVIESVKAASDIYAPVSGEITEVNKDLEDKPEMINKDPYGDGWIFKMKDFSSKELKGLMDAKDYDSFLRRQA